MKNAAADLAAEGNIARVALWILVLGLSVTPPIAGAGPQEAASIAIRGRVLNEDSQPLHGAEVHLFTPQNSYASWLDEPYKEPTAVARTAPDGSFEIRAPAKGLWLVRVSAHGHQAEKFRLLALLEDGSLPPLTLKKTRVVRVQLLAAIGKPVRGAWLLPPIGDSAAGRGLDSWEPDRARQRTDRRGEARVPVPTESTTGRLWTVEHPAFKTTTLDLAEEFVSIHLTPEVQSPAEVQLITGPGRAPWAAGGLIIPVGRRAPVASISESGKVEISGIDRDDPQLQVLVPPGGRPRLLRLEPGDEEGTYRAGIPKAPTIRCRVVDSETAIGLPGVFVWLEDDPGVSARSDQEGVFTLPHPVGSHFRVGLDAEGYLPDFQPIVSKPNRPPLLKLRPAGSLVVAVQDEGGQRVSNLEVRLRLLPSGSGAQQGARLRFRSNLSPTSGEFTLQKLIPMLGHELSVRAPGYAPMIHRWTAQAGRDQRLVLTLQPEHRLKGTVVTLEGEPIAKAEILVVSSAGAAQRRKVALGRFFPGSILASGETGRDGGFQIGELTPGPFDLIVQKRGFSPGVVAGIAFEPGIRDKTLGRLHLASVIEMHGRVVNYEGDGIEGARVFVVYRVDRPGGGSSEVPRDQGRPADLTDAEGGFSLAELEEGAIFTLGVWKEGFVPKKVPGVVPSTGETLRVQLSAGAKLEGSVLDHLGSPLPGAHVEVSAAGGLSGTRFITLYGSRPTATTSADGGFVLSGLLAGAAVVVVRAKGYERKILQDLHLNDEGSLVIQVQLRAGLPIQGITRRDDGYPVVGAAVQGGGERTLTDEEGRFELTSIPEGGARIVASHPSYGAAQRFVDPGAGERDVELTFRPLVSVEGLVLDHRRQPAVGAEVWLQTGLGAPSLQVAGSAGEFVFENVPVVPSLQLRASRAGSIAVEERFHPEAGRTLEVTLILEAACRVRGRVYSVGPPGMVEIFASRPGAATLEGIVLNGSEYLVEGLDEGTWLVAGRNERGNRGEAGVECKATPDEIRKDLMLKEGTSLAVIALFEGEPLADASVTVQNDAGFVIDHGRTDLLGRFLTSGLFPGRHKVMVRSPDRTMLTEASTTLPGPGTLELVLRQDPGPR